MSLLDAVRQANRAGPPEHSIVFRAAAAGTVVVGIAACWAQGELPRWVAVSSIVLVVAGNIFSYRRRTRPLPWLKVGLALIVVAAFAWFLHSVTSHGSVGDMATVEGPLAVLFTWIQVGHAFDVPSRRDLGFSLAGSATLMAVAAAQATDARFGAFVALWAVLGLVGLSAMWGSMTGNGRARPVIVLVSAVAVLAVALAAMIALPPPRASSTVVFPSALAGDTNVRPGGLVGGGLNGTEPARAASVSGRTRVAGFLGFAGPLDTAARGELGKRVVMRVRADRPSYWIAETFDHWDGQSWNATSPRGRTRYERLSSGPPFDIPLPAGESYAGTPDIQTFYLAVSGPNLIFHAANATQVWFPAAHLYASPDSTIKSSTSLGSGSIYTVESLSNRASASQLRHAQPSPFPGGKLSNLDRTRYTQLPHAYPRVAALADRITTNAPTTYDKITALESWVGAHTRYTTDIPPLSHGQDAVDQFLFGNRRGYCEQISTSLAVMLRTLGIPAREATGYVPGPYNPITDLYDVQARDAHAWVQVWFPGYGWQSFDPTAQVPLANPTPADAVAHSLLGALHRVPWIPVAIVVVLLAGAFVVVRRRRDAPSTWPAAMTRALQEAAHRGGLVVEPFETLSATARRLDACWGRDEGPVPGAYDLALAAERAAYGHVYPNPTTQRELLAAARHLAPEARRRRRALGLPRLRRPRLLRRPRPPRPDTGHHQLDHPTVPGHLRHPGEPRDPGDPGLSSPNGHGPAPPPTTSPQPAEVGTP